MAGLRWHEPESTAFASGLQKALEGASKGKWRQVLMWSGPGWYGGLSGACGGISGRGFHGIGELKRGGTGIAIAQGLQQANQATPFRHGQRKRLDRPQAPGRGVPDEEPPGTLQVGFGGCLRRGATASARP